MTKEEKKRWLKSLSTADLIYLKMLLSGQVELDEKDSVQRRIRRSYARARR